MIPGNPTDKQLADACLWLQHDFGLVDENEQRARMDSMRDHWRAVWKACDTQAPEVKPIVAQKNHLNWRFWFAASAAIIGAGVLVYTVIFLLRRASSMM